MRLTRPQTDNYRNKIIQKIGTGHQPSVHENGVFEIHNVQESEKSRILNILRGCDFISQTNVGSQRYDFGHWDFSKGMPQPKQLYTIRGLIKEEEKESLIKEENEGKKIYYLPDTQASRSAIEFFGKEGYKPKVVSLRKLARYNNLLDDKDLGSYHEKEWDNKSPRQFRIDDEKANKWLASEIPMGTLKKDGSIILQDGRHRCRALINQRYDGVEILLRDENTINEDVEIHSELNPKIWDKDKKLLPEVEDKVEDIVDKFVEQLKEDGIEIKVDDIYILGSNANYNYNDDSDLDIHIIADESFDCDKKHLPIIYQAYKTLFNNKYDISFKGINVEIYVENKDDLSNVATGVYSLNDGWIKDPSKFEMPKIDNEKINIETKKWLNRFEKIKANPSVDEIEKFIDDLYDIRIESIKKDGEFGTDNLVFKEVRRAGALDELKELKNKLESNELSINEAMNELGCGTGDPSTSSYAKAVESARDRFHQFLIDNNITETDDYNGYGHTYTYEGTVSSFRFKFIERHQYFTSWVEKIFINDKEVNLYKSKYWCNDLTHIDLLDFVNKILLKKGDGDRCEIILKDGSKLDLDRFQFDEEYDDTSYTVVCLLPQKFTFKDADFYLCAYPAYNKQDDSFMAYTIDSVNPENLHNDPEFKNHVIYFRSESDAQDILNLIKKEYLNIPKLDIKVVPVKTSQNSILLNFKLKDDGKKFKGLVDKSYFKEFKPNEQEELKTININYTPDNLDEIGNKFTFDESAGPDNLYKYEGPAFGYNEEDLGWFVETVHAKSDAQALARFKYIIKDKLHMDAKHTIIYLEPSCVSLVANSKGYMHTNDLKFICPNCGSRLSDDGQCPVCDLGDQSALDESLINESLEPVLYHGTSAVNALTILKDNVLRKDIKMYSNHEHMICLTRSMDNLIKIYPSKSDVIFVLDRDKLKNNYKIYPMGDNKNFALPNNKPARNIKNNKFEEVIKENITNIRKYIVKIIIRKEIKDRVLEVAKNHDLDLSDIKIEER